MTRGGFWPSEARKSGAFDPLTAMSLLLAVACSSCPEAGAPPAARRTDAGSPSTLAHDMPTRALPLEQLHTTLGRLEWTGQVWVHTGPKLRATFPRSRGDSAALRFKYLGGTRETVALKSGQTRRQLGLKLRARDSCNVLYVMWRFDTEGIVVQSKSNRVSRHEECGNDGYHTLRPYWAIPVEPPEPNSTHELAARIDAAGVEVSVDSRVVLRANLHPGFVPATGEAGFRSDNVRFELRAFIAVVPGWPLDGPALER